MPSTYKGIPDLYDTVCGEFDSSFYDWILPPESSTLQVGQLCNAPVWYERKKRWYLTEEHYYPTREEESTWRANIYSGKSKVEREPQHIVAKYFELERSEGSVAVNKNANLVLLSKDPLQNISNTKAIEMVLLKGKLFSSAELQAMLDGVKKSLAAATEPGEQYLGLHEDQ